MSYSLGRPPGYMGLGRKKRAGLGYYPWDPWRPTLDGLGGLGSLGEITTACRNHQTVFRIAWEACTIPPASFAKGACRTAAKLALQTAANSIGKGCPESSAQVICQKAKNCPQDAPPPPTQSGVDTKTLLIAGGVGVGLIIVTMVILK